MADDLFTFAAQRDSSEIPLMRWLADGQWHNGAHLYETHANSVENIAAFKRGLRSMAEEAKGKIVSGQKGYRLTMYASVEEIDRASAELLSLAKGVVERYKALRRFYHKHRRTV
jgi:hypothetical protein